MELVVVVDSRERNMRLIGALESSGISVEVKTLPVGDYLISDRVCIERKTVCDFESSLISTRLFDQVERLKEHYNSPIVIVEGSKEDFTLSSNVITGAIAHLYIDVGAQVIMSDDARDTARIIAALARHEQRGEKRELSPKGGARAHNDAQYQEHIIGNLPGVGAKMARALLKHFGSVRNIANAAEKELMEVDKIGKKKASHIHAVMSGEYNSDVEP